MEIDKKLLEIICCPETQQSLRIAGDGLIEKLNRLIEKKEIFNRSKLPVKSKLDGGLIRKDGKYLYPIIEEIPILLVDEAILLDAIQ